MAPTVTPVLAAVVEQQNPKRMVGFELICEASCCVTEILCCRGPTVLGRLPPHDQDDVFLLYPGELRQPLLPHIDGLTESGLMPFDTSNPNHNQSMPRHQIIARTFGLLRRGYTNPNCGDDRCK